MRLFDGDPYVPMDLLDYLDDFYSLENLLGEIKKEGATNGDYCLGYMQGVAAVKSHLYAIYERSKGDE